MGRFYKTARATPIDYMYRVNAPLLQKVAEVNDAYAEAVNNGLAKIGSFTAPYAPQDKEVAEGLVSGYTTSANSIAKNMQGDAANWRKYKRNLDDLSSKLQADYTKGDLSRIVANATMRQEQFKKIDDNKKISAATAMAAKNYLDKQFAGTKDPVTGRYDKSYGSINLYDDRDIEKEVREVLKEIKPSGSTTTTSTPIGGYIVQEKTGNTGVSADKVMAVVLDKLQDPEIQRYLVQRQQIGLIDGIYNTKKDGEIELLSPVSTVKNIMTPEIQEKFTEREEKIKKQFKNADERQVAIENLKKEKKEFEDGSHIEINRSSYGGRLIDQMVNTFSYQNPVNERTLTSDQTVLSREAQARMDDRAKKNRELQWKIHLDNIEQKERDRAAQKQSTASGKKSSGKGVDIDNNYPDKTVVLPRDGMNNMGATISVGGTRIPLYSVQGLKENLKQKNSAYQTIALKKDKIQKQIKNYTGDKESAEYKLLVSENKALELQLNTAATDAGFAASEFSKYVPDAITRTKNLSGVSEEDIAYYNNAKDLYEGKDILRIIEDEKKEIKDLKRERDYRLTLRPVMGTTYDEKKQKEYDRNRAIIKNMSYHIYNKEANVEKLERVVKAIDKNIDKSATQAVPAYRQDDVLIPTKGLADEVTQLFLLNPAGSRVFDPRTGTDISESNISIGGDSYRANFVDNSLYNKLKEKGYDLRLTHIGGTLGENNGNGGNLTFVAVDKNGVQAGRAIHVALTPQMTEAIGRIVATESESGSQAEAYGKLLQNGFINDIKARVLRGETNIPVTIGNLNTILRIEVDKETGWTTVSMPGNKENSYKRILFPNSYEGKSMGDPGVFNSLTQALQAIQIQKEEYEKVLNSKK